jgi:hypothetical protein
MTDSARSLPLLYDAMAKEWALAHSGQSTLAHGFPPWITDRDPPSGYATYLTSCVNADGAEYIACHYWHNGWHTGPFVRVVGWQLAPPPIAPGCTPPPPPQPAHPGSQSHSRR